MSGFASESRVWSATPTPLRPDFRVDVPSVKRMVAHHVAQNVKGLMLAGTTGEGPWMREADKETLTRAVCDEARGRVQVALQVTDNSPLRILENIEKAAEWGAEIAVVAQPFILMNPTSVRQLEHYREVARHSSLPVGFYDQGAGSPYAMTEPDLMELMTEPNIVIVKDSSSSPARREVYLAARRRRPDLLLLDGDEFNCVEYLKAGYDGLLLGGGIFNARIAAELIREVHAGNLAGAERLQVRMTDLMLRVYGGKQIECWLTGLKELLVQMGIFSTATNLLGYPLTETCRAQIHAAVSGADGMGFRSDLLLD